jgi:TRAP transporter TAXI family solute receptor
MTNRWFKRMSGILVLLMFALSLVGCGGQTDQKSKDGKPAPGQVKRISIIAGASSGSWYLVAGGMAKVINKYVPGVEATAEPGGGAENIIRVANKEVTFGMVMSDNLYYAIKGTREFKEAYPNILAIYGGHDNPMKLLTRADSGINSVADLKGKKVGMGHPGSAQAIASAADLETLGLKVDKDFKAMWLNPGEIADALQDKTIDAGFMYIADPSGAMVDLTTKIPIKFINYDVDKIVQAHPYWYKTKLKAGTYKGQDGDYFCQGANVVLVTHKDTDPELVYQVTKALLEHVDEVAEAHRAGKEWNLQGATRGIATPYHPGAAKYLKEKGVLK